MAYIDQFFDVLIQAKASDLHIGEGEPPKIRVHGEIVPIREEPITNEEAAYMMSEIAGTKGWATYEERGDFDFAYEMNADSRFRCNFLKQTNGYGCVFRLIPTKIATLEQLNVPPVIKTFGNLRGGLVLVTGPRAAANPRRWRRWSTTSTPTSPAHCHHRRAHRVRPPEQAEHHHPARGARAHDELPAGLKAALREDADIVLVGEMRDLETIQLALTAAETGLLVFGTLHTNNSRKTVDRMIDAFPADQQAQVRTMLASSLRGVVAQLLLKKQDGTGRVAVNEILVVNNAVSAIIREGATQKLEDVIVAGKAQGMQFMDDAIWHVMQQGIVSPHEAYMKAIDKNRFQKFLPPEDEGL